MRGPGGEGGQFSPFSLSGNTPTCTSREGGFPFAKSYRVALSRPNHPPPPRERRYVRAHTHTHTHTHPRRGTRLSSSRPLPWTCPLLDAEEPAQPKRKKHFNLKEFPETLLSPGWSGRSKTFQAFPTEGNKDDPLSQLRLSIRID